MEQKLRIETTSFSLHIMAMLFMLCDHVWGTLLTGHEWLTCIGRLTFPIFAFMIVEGYFHTKDLKKYVRRLLLFAILSELPFNLAIGGTAFYPLHQNVLWSFLISIGLIHMLEKARTRQKIWLQVLAGVGALLLACVLGLVTFVDYYHAGILTVLAFYFFRGRKWWQCLGQFLCLWWINLELLGGLVYHVSVFHMDLAIHQQGLALLALIPIWLYRGKQGPHSKALQYLYYGFYPAHLLILWLIRILFW